MPLTNEEKSLRAWLSRLGAVFGMSVHDYYGIRELQGGQCPICFKPVPDPQVLVGPGDPAPARRFPVDHDHKTGVVRGIPCAYCNRYRIGHFTRADLDILRRIVAYIESPPATEYFGRELIVPGHGKRKRRRRRKPVA